MNNFVEKSERIRGISYRYIEKNPNADKTLVLLHGFTGDRSTWLPFMESFSLPVRLIAIDLLGHGQTDSPNHSERYEMNEQIEDLRELFLRLSIDPVSLVGYSMGGRVAIGFATTYPKFIDQLILVSTSPGLQTIEERNKRTQADEKLAERIVRDGIESFVNEWENISLFQSQKLLSEEKQFAIREQRLSQREIGLANSLRGLSTGKQPSYWEHLQYLHMPITWIVGELDEKFVKLANSMKNLASHGEIVVVPNVGHAIQVENLNQFVKIIMDRMK